MPSATPAHVRTAIASRALDPVYLLLGDDAAEITRLAAEIAAVVEDELRAFNIERLYAGDKGTTASAIVEAARQHPMMGDRRIVVVLRGERLLKPKRRGKAAAQDEDEQDDVEPPSDLDALSDYVEKPVPSTTLVLTAADVDKTRRVGKAILKHATVVEFWGLQNGKDKQKRGPDLQLAARWRSRW
jgi:DNA polymerase III delta subunit